jgi:hypothetical protein
VRTQRPDGAGPADDPLGSKRIERSTPSITPLQTLRAQGSGDHETGPGFT